VITNRLVPAILAEDAQVLHQLVRQADSFAGYVQFDIMDGQFVPPRSIDSGDIVISRPCFKWEAHLMVHNPDCLLADFSRAGAKRLIFHIEAVTEPLEVVGRIKRLNIEAGLAINPETTCSFLTKQMAQELDFLLFLSVHPGYYGRPFIPSVLNKIKECRRMFPGLSIGIDGGIKEVNIKEAASAGANEICVGSAIFAQANPADAYQKLLNLARTGWQVQDYAVVKDPISNTL
jgi:ribulose-phosphate 3-epimerase